MTERHFTDRDVAMILQRAAELDSDSASSAEARGLSLSELEDIAREVGIDPSMIARAAQELGRSGGVRSLRLLGPPTVNRHIRALPGELDPEAIRRLMRVVDENVPAQGTIGEALGSVRWTSSDRFLSRQVSVEPGPSETLVRVEERYTDRFRGALHGIPTVYGLVFGFVIGMGVLGSPLGGALFSGLLGSAGWAIAKGVWAAVSRRSRRRVEALGDELESEAALGSRATPEQPLLP